jgi:MFS family permease
LRSSLSGINRVKSAAIKRRRGAVVSTLGITQTLAWASTYYLPAIFADPVSTELHLPRAWFFGIFSGALLLSGLLGPLAGRIIDRHGGRDVLASTNLVFAVGLVLLSFASGIAWLAAAWIVIGFGMGFGLYEAAFATVTGLYGRDARNAITGITLFAGFASTVGWPASAFLIAALGWRDACLIWAGLHLLVGLPLNRLLVPKAPSPPHEQAIGARASSGVPWTMIVLAGVFGATWFISTAMAAHLPRLLEALGAAPAMAVFSASLVGPAQVAERLVEFTVLRRASPMFSARLATGLHPGGAVLLALLGPAAALPFVLMHGRQRPSGDRAGRVAARAVRCSRIWASDRHSRGSRPHPSGRRSGLVRLDPRPGRPTPRPTALRYTDGLLFRCAAAFTAGTESLRYGHS